MIQWFHTHIVKYGAVPVRTEHPGQRFARRGVCAVTLCLPKRQAVRLQWSMVT